MFLARMKGAHLAAADGGPQLGSELLDTLVVRRRRHAAAATCAQFSNPSHDLCDGCSRIADAAELTALTQR